jgi:dephospho-CoA kinase
MKTREQPESGEVTIGLLGNAACGKDTVAGVFEEFGFSHQSASDIVREEIIKLGQEPSRKLQTETADRIRLEQGEEYFILAAIKRARLIDQKLIVVSGIYAPGEGAFIKSKGGHLVNILPMPSDTPEHQYHRLVNRASGSRDQATYEEFMAARERENSGTSPGHANVRSLSKMSDFTIVHDGDPTTIRPQVETIIERVL